MMNPIFNNQPDPDPLGQAPLLSDFIQEMAGAPLENSEYEETGMVVETLTIALPVECLVETENGRPAIRVMTPLRTETSIQPVLHGLIIKVVLDADP
jgi:hypothetical protein